MKLHDRQKYIKCLEIWKIIGIIGVAEILEIRPTTLHSKTKKKGEGQKT